MMKNLKSILTITLTLTLNTFFSQVVINEVNARPSGSQGLIFYNGNSGNEYIELYNPSCSPVDVSGYFIGMRQEFAGNASGGSFRIPSVAAAVIPANGHLVLGTATSSADPNSIDIKLPDYTSNYCQNSSVNLILANADGWLGLYDAAGTPIDALYWSAAAGNISQGADYGGLPCVPAGSPAGVILESAQQINNSFPGVLSYAGNTPNTGLTFSRIPDGGAWSGGVNPSVNDLTTGNCNGGTCQTAAVFSISAVVLQPSCSNDDGSITINTNPAAGAYTYTWTPNASTTSSAINLSAGTYDVIIDLNGCQKDTSITLVAGTGPSGIVVTPTNPSCGQADGSISLGAVTGGTNPYTYSLNGGGFSGILNYNNLAANTYTLVVQDANGCTYNAPNITLINSSTITAIGVSVVDPTCGQSNGSVDLGAVTGGTGPYTYNFDGLGFSGQMNYPSLGAGTYPLVVQDNNGCIFNAPDVILTNGNGPSAIAVTSVDPSCGQTDGSISLGLVTGGVGPYQYNLGGNGLSPNQIYNNLGAGPYTLVVEDANGCAFSAPDIILSNGNGPSAISVSTTDPGCGQSNGTITLGLVTGGTGPYTYNLGGAGFNAQLNYNNLASGSYTLIVQDNGGCTYNAPDIILNDISGPTAAVSTVIQPSCGLSNGSIQISNVTGGVLPYQYNFNGQGFTASNSFLNQNGGTVSIEIRDANACVFIAPNVVLTNSAPIVDLASVITEPSCGQSNGAISLGNVSGGTAAFEYNFNNGGFGNTMNFQNLPIGNYSVVVRDALGCTFSTNYTLIGSTPPVAAQIDALNANCGNMDGSISISNIVGGLAPYQVSLNGSPFNQNLSITNLGAGFYSIIIEDANACQYATQATITSSSNPLANFLVDNNQVSIIAPLVNATNFSSTDVVSFTWIANASVPNTSTEENPSFDFSLQDPGFYPITLIVENSDGCKDTVVNYIEFIDEPLVFVPNTFTPDGNEINNTWEIVTSGLDIMDFNLLIFNRWGQLIWESNDASVGWDGTYNNRLVAIGVYTWKISAKDKRRSTVLYYNGFVNVIY
jgi:gliding motility-associated-like protein